MPALHNLLCFASIALYVVPVAAQIAPATTNDFGSAAWHAPSKPGRSYLGLNLGRSNSTAACDSFELVCNEKDRTAHLYAGALLTDTWRVEVGVLKFGRIPHLRADVRAQGLNLSLVGKARLGNSVGVFAKLGTTYGRTDTSSMGAGPEQGFGVSWAGGVSYNITSRLSATLEMDSHELRLPGGSRDPLRSTSLGLQYRY